MRFSKKKGRQIASALAPKSLPQSRLQMQAKLNIEEDEFNIEEDVSTQKMKPY